MERMACFSFWNGRRGHGKYGQFFLFGLVGVVIESMSSFSLDWWAWSWKVCPDFFRIGQRGHGKYSQFFKRKTGYTFYDHAYQSSPFIAYTNLVKLSVSCF